MPPLAAWAWAVQPCSQREDDRPKLLRLAGALLIGALYQRYVYLCVQLALQGAVAVWYGYMYYKTNNLLVNIGAAALFNAVLLAKKLLGMF